MVCKKRRGEEKEVKVDFSHFCCFLLHILSFCRRMGGTPKKRTKRRKDLGEKENGFEGLLLVQMLIHSKNILL